MGELWQTRAQWSHFKVVGLRPGVKECSCPKWPKYSKEHNLNFNWPLLNWDQKEERRGWKLSMDYGRGKGVGEEGGRQGSRNIYLLDCRAWLGNNRPLSENVRSGEVRLGC